MYIQQKSSSTKKYTLGKSERIKSRKLIDELFKDGTSFLIFPIRTYFQFIKGEGKIKAGFAVSSRNFRKAVDRNRIKRLMKESYRVQKGFVSNDQLIEKDLIIFFLYTGKDIAEFALIKEKIGASLQNLSRIIDENASANP